MTEDERKEVGRRFDAARAALFELEESLGPYSEDNFMRREVYGVRVQLGNLDIPRRIAREAEEEP